MQKYVDEQNVATIFYTVFNIVADFWKAQGYNFAKILCLKDNIVFAKILDEACFGPEDIIQQFIKAVRHEIPKYLITEKNKNVDYENAIRFDESYIYIQPACLVEILKNRGLNEYMPHILTQLKEKELLSTDNDGFTKKLQVNGIRKEYYKFENTFFDVTGETKFTDLGKDIV